MIKPISYYWHRVLASVQLSDPAAGGAPPKIACLHKWLLHALLVLLQGCHSPVHRTRTAHNIGHVTLHPWHDACVQKLLRLTCCPSSLIWRSAAVAAKSAWALKPEYPPAWLLMAISAAAACALVCKSKKCKMSPHYELC